MLSKRKRHSALFALLTAVALCTCAMSASTQPKLSASAHVSTPIVDPSAKAPSPTALEAYRLVRITNVYGEREVELAKNPQPLRFDAIFNEDAAIRVAGAVFSSHLGWRTQAIENREIKHLFFDEKDGIWIAYWWSDNPGSDLVYCVAIQKADGKILALWNPETRPAINEQEGMIYCESGVFQDRYWEDHDMQWAGGAVCDEYAAVEIMEAIYTNIPNPESLQNRRLSTLYYDETLDSWFAYFSSFGAPDLNGYTIIIQRSEGKALLLQH